MKNIIRMAFAAFISLCAPFTASAQLNNLLKNTAGSLLGSDNAANAVTNIVTNLLGNEKLSEQNLVGTWIYEEPCVVLESQDILGKLGSTLITNKIIAQETKALQKIGFTKGKVVLTLNQDKSGSIKVGQRTTPLSWNVSSSNLTLTILTRDIKINAKLKTNNLQLAMNADKLLSLVSAAATGAAKVNNNFGVISTLLNKYNGLYLGLKFKK